MEYENGLRTEYIHVEGLVTDALHIRTYLRFLRKEDPDAAALVADELREPIAVLLDEIDR